MLVNPSDSDRNSVEHGSEDVETRVNLPGQPRILEGR